MGKNVSSFDASFVDVGNDIRLHVMRRRGAGRKYVFLHGFGEGGFVWLPFTRTVPASADLYVIDLRGHGESSWHPLQEYATEDYVHDVLRVFAELELHDVVLVGHSLGARIAICVADHLPERLWRLVLVDVGLETSTAAREKIVQDFVEGTKLFSKPSDYLDFITLNRPLADIDILREISSHALREHAEGQYRTKADPALAHVTEGEDLQEFWSRLSTISVKSLLVRGAGSAVLSSKGAMKIVTTMPLCSAVTVEIAGHGVMVDNPTAFSAAVNQFLANSETAPY